MQIATLARDRCLEAVKRPAISTLHRSSRGERLILRMYLEGEEHAEHAVLLDAQRTPMPRWLEKWLEHHQADEARHASLLRTRLRELTGEDVETTGHMDPVSRWKTRRLLRLANEWAARFEQGHVVPLLAVAWRMERMAVRVFERHIDVLERGGSTSPTLDLLRELLADEKRHAAAMQRSLIRLTTVPEWDDVQLLVARIDGVERSFGITGAVIMLTMGALYRLAS
jgi:rubrerythrin